MTTPTVVVSLVTEATPLTHTALLAVTLPALGTRIVVSTTLPIGVAVLPPDTTTARQEIDNNTEPRAIPSTMTTMADVAKPAGLSVKAPASTVVAVSMRTATDMAGTTATNTTPAAAVALPLAAGNSLLPLV